MPYFKVTIIREAGNEPLSGRFVEAAQEELTIKALDKHDAYRISQRISRLMFTGQVRKTFINDEEYRNPKY